MGVPHGKVVEGDGDKKRIKRVRAVGDGFSGRCVATGGRHQGKIRIKIKIKEVFSCKSLWQITKGAGGWGQPPLPSGELGQLWEKRSGYEKKFEKIVDGIGGFDTLSLPLMSDSKFLSDLWGKSAFFDNGVFFCLVTDKGIQSTAVLF